MGCGGYLANRVSACDFWHSRNCEPRPDTTMRIHWQDWQRDLSKIAVVVMTIGLLRQNHEALHTEIDTK